MRSTTKAVLTVLIVLIAVIVSVLFVSSRYNIFPHMLDGLVSQSKPVIFPSIDMSQLSSTQRKIVTTLKQEYEAQPAGTKYSEGTDEPWCADFVSWVYRQSDVSLKNPNSGSWRIPGTYTLRDYYRSVGKFKSPDSGYTPKVGDIMLYDNPSIFGQHTNIVLSHENGTVTTIGGNEPGGIRIITHSTNRAIGFVGYGVL